MKNSNILTNRNNLLAGTYGFVVVHIDTSTLDYAIIRIDNGQKLGEGKASSLNDAKKNVKTALASLGVVFDKEQRVRSNNETISRN